MDMAKVLKYSIVDTAHYSKQLLVAYKASAQCPGDASSSKVPVKKEKQKKTQRSTLKYSFANWLRYFFGDFPVKNGLLVLSPPTEQPLRHGTFLVFWLSRFVFLGPSRELVSPNVRVIASLLAEGRRLSLGPLYLGSFYTCLDQVQEQCKISFG